jgi:uncharacterized protein (DUF2141 family)
MILKSNGSLLAAATLFGGVMAIAGAVHATSIGVQFTETGDGKTVPVPAATSAGYGSYAQANWNQISGPNSGSTYTGSITAPMNSAGAASTGITFSYAGVHEFNQGASSGAPANGNEDLLSGAAVVESSSSPATLSFSGLGSGTYSLLVYTDYQGNGTNAYGAKFSVNGGSGSYVLEQDAAAFYATPTFTSNPAATAAGVSKVSNYLLFTNLTPVSGTISISYEENSAVSGGTGHIGVNAIQLVTPAVPEPAPLALLAIGGLGLVLLRRKARAMA